MQLVFQNPRGYSRQRDIDDAIDGVTEDLQAGVILTPNTAPAPTVLAGGKNFFPNSDCNFSTRAATVAGTLPGDAGDDNQELWRFYWIESGDPVVLDAAHAVKAVGHSLFAANEGVNTGIPIWDRNNGRLLIGASGGQQYDVVVQLTRNFVGPGEEWFLGFRALALTNDILSADLEAFGGLWQLSGAYEGYAKGSPFDLTFLIEGVAGAQSINYRGLAETDSDFAILSNVLNVPNAPNVLSANNYVKVFYGAGRGFISFKIYKEAPGGTFQLVHEVRNTNDIQFNDVGAVGIAEAGWPVEPNDRPLAYAQTKDMLIGPYLGAFLQNKMSVLAPDNYDAKLTNSGGQFVRFGFLAPTAVDRQVAFDYFWWSTTFNAWSPDSSEMFTQEAFTLPSAVPSSGQPGGGGVTEPPVPGSGGGEPPREFTIA